MIAVTTASSISSSGSGGRRRQAGVIWRVTTTGDRAQVGRRVGRQVCRARYDQQHLALVLRRAAVAVTPAADIHRVRQKTEQIVLNVCQ